MLEQLYKAHIERKSVVFSEALERSELKQLLIASGTQQYLFRDDMTHPYRSHSYFREWVPLQLPNSFLLYESGKKPVLFIQSVADFWHTPPDPIDDWTLHEFEVVEYTDIGQVSECLKRPDHLGLVGDSADFSYLKSEAKINPESCLHYIDFHRAWKTEYEIACMRKANEMAIPAHRMAEKLFRDGCSEYEINMGYLAALESREEQLPYGNIIALGSHAAVLHHTVLGTIRADARSFLIDAGAACNGYASDISRTYALDSAFAEYKKLIAGVNALEQELVGAVKPGVLYTDIHLLAHRGVAELLCDIGVLNCSPEQAINQGLTLPFFPHGVGHLIGAQVHDRGGHMASDAGEMNPPPDAHPFLRCTRTLQEGMVVTIEPGVYFIPILLAPYADSKHLNHDLIEQLKPLGGVRIEDDVCVRNTAPQNLTRDAFAIIG